MKMNKKRGFLLVFEMKPTDASTSHPRDEHVGIAENLVKSHDGLGPMVVQLDSLEKIEGFFFHNLPAFLNFRQYQQMFSINTGKNVSFSSLLAPRDLDDLLPLRPERGVELDEDLSRATEPDPLDGLDLGRRQGRLK